MENLENSEINKEDTILNYQIIENHLEYGDILNEKEYLDLDPNIILEDKLPPDTLIDDFIYKSDDFMEKVKENTNQEKSLMFIDYEIESKDTKSSDARYFLNGLKNYFFY
ncbi:hypothetical protein DMUE_3584 [Dictyocoela muelleri]|nr:hypothetical protein DMUE_3584 [Dictyocoela muelleri]